MHIDRSARCSAHASHIAVMAVMTGADPIRYDIIDSHTRTVVGTAKTLRGAHASADRRDNAYGAYRYAVKAIYA